mmetsp:Transcript_874/g.2965  ORF Transcript_874/g.2965 Transcript_874/m.2965 type:complete len:260 (-) Transcript_874:1365-2144(-)
MKAAPTKQSPTRCVREVFSSPFSTCQRCRSDVKPFSSLCAALRRRCMVSVSFCKRCASSNPASRRSVRPRTVSFRYSISFLVSVRRFSRFSFSCLSFSTRCCFGCTIFATSQYSIMALTHLNNSAPALEAFLMSSAVRPLFCSMTPRTSRILDSESVFRGKSRTVLRKLPWLMIPFPMSHDAFFPVFVGHKKQIISTTATTFFDGFENALSSVIAAWSSSLTAILAASRMGCASSRICCASSLSRSMTTLRSMSSSSAC